MRGVGLDHADQAMAIAQGVVDQGEITGLENVERHLAPRQQQRSRKREYRDHLRQINRATIHRVHRHRCTPTRLANLLAADTNLKVNLAATIAPRRTRPRPLPAKAGIR